MTARPKYKRILLKLSGEALMGNQKFGVEHEACAKIAHAIYKVLQCGVQVGLVVGGGNIFRGSQAKAFGFSRTPADQIGMMATMINGMALQQTLASLGIEARVMSAISCATIVENYSWPRTMHILEAGGIPIFVGGTGNPYFTTDTAAALRASEIEAHVLFKATKVDGVYDKDPLKYPDAIKYPQLRYADALSAGLNVMDATALALCRENRIPICVFNIFQEGALQQAVLGEGIGSLIQDK